MQTTRPVTSEAIERRHAPASAAVEAPRPRKRSYGKLLFYFLAVGSIVATSIIGTGWIPLGPNSDASASDATPIDSNFVVGFGYVDIEDGLINISPTQMGKVTEVPAKENKNYKKGVVLLRTDDRLAKFRVEEALADMK